MRINLKGTNVELNQNIRDYLDKRLQGLRKILDMNDPSLMMDVELGRVTMHHKTGDVFRAEINIFMAGKTYRAEAESGDLNSAIDLMKNEIMNEISDDKRKRISFIRRSGQRVKEIIKGLYRRKM